MRGSGNRPFGRASLGSSRDVTPVHPSRRSPASGDGSTSIGQPGHRTPDFSQGHQFPVVGILLLTMMLSCYLVYGDATLCYVMILLMCYIVLCDDTLDVTMMTL
jgi:hypothetical protein